MKKLIAILLTLCAIVCLAACGDGSKPAESAPSDGQTAAENFSVTCKNVKITMHADAAPIIAALGDPLSCTEQASCAFDGLDKTYSYGGFVVTTYPNGDKDYISGLWFADDSLTNDEGVYIGAPKADVERAYGADKQNGSAFVIEKGKSKLTVMLGDNDAVASIQYIALFD